MKRSRRMTAPPTWTALSSFILPHTSTSILAPWPGHPCRRPPSLSTTRRPHFRPPYAPRRPDTLSTTVLGRLPPPTLSHPPTTSISTTSSSLWYSRQGRDKSHPMISLGSTGDDRSRIQALSNSSPPSRPILTTTLSLPSPDPPLPKASSRIPKNCRPRHKWCSKITAVTSLQRQGGLELPRRSAIWREATKMASWSHGSTPRQESSSDPHLLQTTHRYEPVHGYQASLGA